ncbi:hypothetical protein D3C75_1258390 [compost metagenome]
MQGGQGFAVFAVLAGLRIDGGQDAARTRLDHAELDLADTNALPAILGEGFAALDHQIRPETQHFHRTPDLV